MTEPGLVTEKIKNQIGKQVPRQLIQEQLRRPRPSIRMDGWNEDVERGAIKKWAIAFRDFNPLWLDEESAKKTRWGGIVAPPLFLYSVDMGYRVPHTLWDWGWAHGPEFTGSDWEFFRPVRPGDKITTMASLTDAYEKKDESKRRLFLVSRTDYTNQKGELVATQQSTYVVTAREESKKDSQS